jgi:predicted metal-dependent HD superfamily phosphohydrolase
MEAARLVAAEHYEDLPYHSWAHAERAAEHGVALVARCREDGVEVDEDVVRVALWFHDAGYRADPASVGCATREEHAAAIAAYELGRLQFPLPVVTAVVGCIIATTADRPATTVEQKAVRAADLADVAGDWGLFTANSAALRAEHELLTGKEMTDGAWRTATATVLARYLTEDIRVTSGHDAPDGVSEWHRRALANVARYLAEQP